MGGTELHPEGWSWEDIMTMKVGWGLMWRVGGGGLDVVLPIRSSTHAKDS